MIVKYSEQDIFELTDDEFKAALMHWNKGKSVFITRLGVSLSPYYRWAGEKPNNPDLGYAREDGRKVFKKFNEWRFVECPDLNPDLNYYKSLARDDVMTEVEKKQIGGGRKFIE